MLNQVQHDRNVPRKPRLVGGFKGHNMKKDYLAGKPRPVGGELHTSFYSPHYDTSPKKGEGIIGEF